MSFVDPRGRFLHRFSTSAKRKSTNEGCGSRSDRQQDRRLDEGKDLLAITKGRQGAVRAVKRPDKTPALSVFA
jgi:hypothetical protein